VARDKHLLFIVQDILLPKVVQNCKKMVFKTATAKV